MRQKRTAKPVSAPSAGMMAASIAGAAGDGWRQSLLLRVTGSGGSAGTILGGDPLPLVLGDGTRISFATADHH
jgi:hypothetical protein